MVVIILNINNYNVHCILVDNGSAIDILYFLTFSQMNLFMDRLVKYGFLIQDFFNEPIPVERVLTLLAPASHCLARLLDGQSLSTL